MSSNGNHVYIYNRTRERFLGTEVTIADSYLRRLVGLLGKTKGWPRPGRGLWIIPSRGVHTIGMMFSIDLVFLDAKNIVVDIQEFVRPFRISTSFRASSVLELPSHTIFRTGTQVGDKLEITPSG